MESPRMTPDDGIAYLNGEWIPLREAKLPIWDLGIVTAATVTEAVRTFRQEPFRLNEHLARLGSSLRGVEIKPEESLERIGDIAREVIRLNAGAYDDGDELLVNIFVTAGESLLHSGGLAVKPGRATVCVSCRRLDSQSASRQYGSGIALTIPSVRHIPPSIIDPHIKYRSRLHWYLADREAQRIDPGSESLLLDLDGYVTETSRGNVFGVFGGELRTPSAETTLAGVSQAVVLSLADALGMKSTRANMSAQEFAAADEILLSSTTACVVPVTRLNGLPVGSGKSGPVWRRLIDAWSASVGVDIVQQALSASSSLPSIH